MRNSRCECWVCRRGGVPCIADANCVRARASCIASDAAADNGGTRGFSERRTGSAAHTAGGPGRKELLSEISVPRWTANVEV
jgi:hypothetical protein